MVRSTPTATMSLSRTVLQQQSASVPRYRAPQLAHRLPPPKLPLFRNVVAHPPAPWASQQGTQDNKAAPAPDAAKGKGKGKGKAEKVRQDFSSRGTCLGALDCASQDCGGFLSPFPGARGARGHRVGPGCDVTDYAGNERSKRSGLAALLPDWASARRL